VIKNIFEIEKLPEGQAEIIDELLKQPGVRIERIISNGQTTPPGEWYDQDEHEWVILLQGEATLEFEDGTTEILLRGSHKYLAPHQKHRVANTSSEPPCIWLALFFIINS
jgi:cupin 2 domain-containing protein